MRKIVYFLGLLFSGVLLFSGCNVSEMSTLSDLSKPYVGFYECEQIQLGNEDMTERFDYIRLELSYGGEFSLTYKSKEGNEGGYGGTYSADTGAHKITLNANVGQMRKSFTFPMENGKIYADYMLRGKLLHAIFSAP